MTTVELCAPVGGRFDGLPVLARLLNMRSLQLSHSGEGGWPRYGTSASVFGTLM